MVITLPGGLSVHDRATCGFVAGLLGAFVQMIFTYSVYYGTGLLKFRFADYAGIIFWGSRPEGLLQSVFAEFLVWFYSGVLGAVFALLIKIYSSEHLMMKGFSFGILYWYLNNGYITAFRVEGLYPIGFTTAAIHVVGGIILGLTTAKAYAYLAKKYRIEENAL